MQTNSYEGWVKRDGLEAFYPRNAQSPTITGASGLAWTWTSITQMTAATIEDFALWGLQANCRVVFTPTSSLSGVSIVTQVLTGASGHEIPIGEYTLATMGTMSNAGPSTQPIIGISGTKILAPQVIQKGTRLSFRMRCNQPDTTVTLIGSCYLIGYPLEQVPLPYGAYNLRSLQSGTSRATTIVYPDDSMISVTGNSTWGTYGSFVQVHPAVPDDTIITGVNWLGAQSALASSHYMEIATGAAGSEVSRARVAFPGLGFANGGNYQLIRPLFIKAGERIALRVTGNNNAMQYSLECIKLNSTLTTTSTTTTSTSTTSTTTSVTTSSTTTTTTSTTTTTTSTTRTTTSTTSTTSSTTRSTSSSSSTSTTTASTSSSTTTL